MESPFNQAFISGSSDGTIKIWDSRTKESVRTIQTLKKAKVFCLDTNADQLVAGMDREIGIWDLKMMKNIYRCKFAHCEDVISVKLRDNTLISGGEDNIINVFDLTNGLDMDSVVSTANIGQSLQSVDFLDKECNYIQACTTVYSFHIVNMFTGVDVFNFDAKSETYNTDYILDSFFNEEAGVIQLFCGNNFGDIATFDLKLNGNDGKIQFDTLLKTGFTQSFNSVGRISSNQKDSQYVAVSDEGLLYIIEKQNEAEKAESYLKELMIVDDIEEEKEDLKINQSKIKSNNKNRSKNGNKFNPY